MVTAAAYRWDLGASLCRETLDAGLGAPPVVASTSTSPAGQVDLAFDIRQELCCRSQAE